MADLQQQPCGKAAASGTARRRREQQVRATGKHVAWLTSLLQASAHHEASPLGVLLKQLSDDNAQLMRRVELLEAPVGERTRATQEQQVDQQHEQRDVNSDTLGKAQVKEVQDSAQPKALSVQDAADGSGLEQPLLWTLGNEMADAMAQLAATKAAEPLQEAARNVKR